MAPGSNVMICTWALSLRLTCSDIWHPDSGAVWGYGTFGAWGLTGGPWEAGFWRLSSLHSGPISLPPASPWNEQVSHTFLLLRHHDRWRPPQTRSSDKPFLPQVASVKVSQPAAKKQGRVYTRSLWACLDVSDCNDHSILWMSIFEPLPCSLVPLQWRWSGDTLFID